MFRIISNETSHAAMAGICSPRVERTIHRNLTSAGAATAGIRTKE
jgi:hypothetical protein